MVPSSVWDNLRPQIGPAGLRKYAPVLRWLLIAGLVIAACVLSPPQALGAAPVASDASYEAAPGGILTITLEAIDGDGDFLDYIITSLPSSGTLTDSTNLTSDDLPYTIPAKGKVITYTANSDGHGTDTFQFKANDGGADSNAATISVLVNLKPVGTANTFFTPPNTDLKVTFPAEDPDGDTLSYTVTSLPGHGQIRSGTDPLADDDVPFASSSADITYTPDQDYHGSDTFNFTASDGNATSDTIAVNIEVNTTPQPDDLGISVAPGTSVTFTLSATDADKDPVHYEIASLPTHGTLALAGSAPFTAEPPIVLSTGQDTFVYTVTPGYAGTDSFHYRAHDAVSVSDRAVVTLAVNTLPVASDSTWLTTEDTSFDGSLAATDADGDALTARVTRLPAIGTLELGTQTVSNTTTTYAIQNGSLEFTYTPDADQSGTDSFDWVAHDGRADSAAATVTVIIEAAPVNEEPDPPTEPGEGSEEPDSGEDEPAEGGEDEDPSSDDEQVAGEAEEPLTGPCGLLVFEVAVIGVGLRLMPRRVFRERAALHRRSGSYK